MKRIFPLVIVLCAICVCAPGAGAAGRYVALGDSNSTGSGLGATFPGSIPNCYRTVNGYPSMVATALGISDFASATCSSAAARNFTEAQALYPSGSAPPQFNSLNGSETIVSITIGGNDAGFGYVIGNCFQSTTATPSATPCRNAYGSNGATLVQAASDMAYGLGLKLDQLHQISPNATVYVVGYPRLIPPDGANCWGRTNISAADAPVFDIWQRAVADQLKSVSAAHDAVYVDMYDASAGHDGCQNSDKWTNEDKNNPASGWNNHPTLAGEQAMAQRLVAAINTPRTRTVDGQSLSLAFASKRVRGASSRAKLITKSAPSKHGARFSVTLILPANVKFVAERVKPGRLSGGKCRAPSRRAGKGLKACRRYVRAESISLSLPAATSNLYFTGRSGNKRLPPGKYRLRAATGSLSVSSPTFKLAR